MNMHKNLSSHRFYIFLPLAILCIKCSGGGEEFQFRKDDVVFLDYITSTFNIPKERTFSFAIQKETAGRDQILDLLGNESGQHLEKEEFLKLNDSVSTVNIDSSNSYQFKFFTQKLLEGIMGRSPNSWPIELLEINSPADLVLIFSRVHFFNLDGNSFAMFFAYMNSGGSGKALLVVLKHNGRTWGDQEIIGGWTN